MVLILGLVLDGLAEIVADRFLAAAEKTLQLLAGMPGRGERYPVNALARPAAPGGTPSA